MKSFSSTQKTILQMLQSGEVLSGAELGTTLGVSRTAIWKQIQTLMEMGVPLSTHHQGYSLMKPCIFLNEERIQQYLLAHEFTKPTRIHLFATLDSTNDFLKKQTPSSHFEICTTERQTQGRGRFNRYWHSPFAEHIYVSFKIHFDMDLSSLSGLSLCIGLSIIQALRDLEMDTSFWLKWPNDVYWQDKKLAGTLIEINAESHAFGDLIIGVGLNVGAISDDLPEAISLEKILKQPIDRNHIIALLAIQIFQNLSLFFHQGLHPFLSAYEQVDYLKGKNIILSQQQEHISGVGAGINEKGQLLVIDTNNQIRCFSAGDTSVKKRPES